MTRLLYGALFAAGLIIPVFIAGLQNSPGYMDAEYYAVGGLQLAQGEGFWEPFRWNYLDPYNSLPHPSHSYWMPLASLIAGLGMKVTGSSSFWAARIPFIIIAGLIPPMTAWFTASITGKSEAGFLAGSLALFPGLYLPYTATTDTFYLTMLLGVLFLQTAWSMVRENQNAFRLFSLFLLLGIFGGLMHLARADGLIWFFTALGIGAVSYGHGRSWQMRLYGLLFVCLGYLIIMGPWYTRNVSLYGSFFPEGTNRTLWLTNYDETFVYETSILSFRRWIETGFGSIIASRAEAMAVNLQRVIAEQGAIFLTPLILLGGWRLRRDQRIRWSVLLWIAISGLMTFVFPFAGSRGGLFHSAAALQPVLWACAAAGFYVAIEWGVRKRGWEYLRASRMFSIGLIGLCILLSGVSGSQRIIGSSLTDPIWNENWNHYTQVDLLLNHYGVDSTEVGMVVNPPGFYWSTGRPSVVTPHGDLSDLIRAARTYQATYLILEKDHAVGLEPLYQNPETNGHFIYMTTFNGTHIFQIDLNE